MHHYNFSSIALREKRKLPTYLTRPPHADPRKLCLTAATAHQCGCHLDPRHKNPASSSSTIVDLPIKPKLFLFPLLHNALALTILINTVLFLLNNLNRKKILGYRKRSS
ncbi:hypothetical protein V6N13_111340 [Hibiscus sabdariffa]|uniref:Transmembrane protein n=1 Tax=Hibiscus sabdariffa TaxID=183260 RepID=A0ABR2TKS2_9ROSI